MIIETVLITMTMILVKTTTKMIITIVSVPGVVQGVLDSLGAATNYMYLIMEGRLYSVSSPCLNFKCCAVLSVQRISKDISDPITSIGLLLPMFITYPVVIARKWQL